MPISFACPQCGKKLKAPDSAVGKSSKCPGCGTHVTCPEPIYDAEPVDARHPAPGGVDPDAELDPEQPYALAEAEPAPAASTSAESRRPCPMCGELIIATAAKCRYCGEIFDPMLKKSSKVRGLRGGTQEDLRIMARTQRNLITCVLILLVSYIASIVVSVIARPQPNESLGVGAGLIFMVIGLALLGSFVAAAIFAFMLAIKIYNVAIGIVVGILSLVPCVNLIVLLTINGQATGILRENGYHVGFLGADLSEF